MILICERMGWTFTEYAQQPARLINYLLGFREGREAGRDARAELSDNAD